MNGSMAPNSSRSSRSWRSCSSACRGCIFHYITKWKTRGDADHRGRESARRAARSRPPARRPDADDRADHPGRESRTGARSATTRSRPRSRTAPSGSTRPPSAPTAPPQEEMMTSPRTKFYLDKQNAKWSGVCAGIADYTGIDVTLVRIGFVLGTVFSGSGMLLLAYFIIAWMAPHKPSELYEQDPRAEEVLAGRARQSAPHRPRRALALPRPRPPARRRRDLCDQLEQPARPRDRAAALTDGTGGREHECRGCRLHHRDHRDGRWSAGVAHQLDPAARLPAETNGRRRRARRRSAQGRAAGRARMPGSRARSAGSRSGSRCSSGSPPIPPSAPPARSSSCAQREKGKEHGLGRTRFRHRDHRDLDLRLGR